MTDVRDRIQALRALPGVDQVERLPGILLELHAGLQDALLVKDATRVRIEPGDVVVVRLAGRHEAKRMHEIALHLEPVFPGTRVLVLDDGVTLDVVNGERAKELQP